MKGSGTSLAQGSCCLHSWPRPVRPSFPPERSRTQIEIIYAARGAYKPFLEGREQTQPRANRLAASHHEGGPSMVADRIEDYALIGDTRTAALVSRGGSIDWFCTPRFDSGACFAALLGDTDNGHWSICPQGTEWRVTRRYRGDTLVLETDFVCAGGHVRLIDFMPLQGQKPRIVRIVEGVRGRVPMTSELAVRFDYGSRVPWVRRVGKDLEFVAGPDALRLDFEVEMAPRGLTHAAQFEVTEGRGSPSC